MTAPGSRSAARADRDRASLERRLEVLRLPVVALRNAGYLTPSPTDRTWERTPQAVGVGPEHQALAVWPSRDDPRRKLVTVHDGGRNPVRSVVLDGCLDPRFVQPLPDGRILVVRSRNRSGNNAEIWTGDGRLDQVGDFGDAIEDVFTTPAGDIWVSYFDEAKGGSGPQENGLARFTGDLRPAWLYPGPPAAPEIFDCYALNVTGETAWTCAYIGFHLVSARGDRFTDHGVAPRRSADKLLVDGPAGALLGGPGPEYDLVTGFRIDSDGPAVDGPPRRLVLPDGLEVRTERSAGRGPELHVFIGTAWYRADLEQLSRRSGDTAPGAAGGPGPAGR